MKATITTVKIGNLEIEGLMNDEGEFGVAVTQLNAVVQFSNIQNTASRDLKRILPEALTIIQKWVTPLNSKAVNVLPLPVVERIIVMLSIAGNEVAQQINLALVGLSLTQLFSDAFGVKFDIDDRQDWLKKRQNGKVARRNMTDAIKLYIDCGDVTDTYARFVYSNCSDAINKSVLGGTAKQLCVARNVEKAKLRDNLTADELHTVEAIEHLAMKLIDKEYEPLSAVRMAIELLT